MALWNRKKYQKMQAQEKYLKKQNQYYTSVGDSEILRIASWRSITRSTESQNKPAA